MTKTSIPPEAATDDADFNLEALRATMNASQGFTDQENGRLLGAALRAFARSRTCWDDPSWLAEDIECVVGEDGRVLLTGPKDGEFGQREFSRVEGAIAFLLGLRYGEINGVGAPIVSYNRFRGGGYTPFTVIYAEGATQAADEVLAEFRDEDLAEEFRHGMLATV